MFRGSVEAIENQLIALTDIEKQEKEGLWYGSQYRNAIKLIVNAPDGPPRDFTELRGRINDSWFTQTYGKDPTKAYQLASIQKSARGAPNAIEGLGVKLWPIIDDLESRVRSDGFALEDARAANLSIKLSSAQYTGRYFMEFALAHVLDCAYNRLKRETLLVIDEFGVLGGSNMAHLMAVGREAGLHVMFTAQAHAFLGDRTTQEQILSVCNTQIFFKLMFPEYASDLSGTTLQPETSYQSEEGVYTGLTSTRFQHQYAIEPNMVRSLPKGQCFVYRDGRNARVEIGMLDPQILPTPPAEQVYIPPTPIITTVPQANHPTPWGKN
jgi:hypothetical protein